MENKTGDSALLLPKQNKWDSFMRAIDMFSDDFMADGRPKDMVQEREELVALKLKTGLNRKFCYLYI